MRRTLLILGLVVATGLAVLWATGALAALERAAAAAQRDVQNALAGAIRAIRRGDPGAVAALMALCFGYGFVHAAGPGHGKMLVGAYGLARRVRLGPLAAIAVVSSLAQATVAVAVVYAGVLLLGLTRERLVGLSEAYLTPLGYAMVATLGLWLGWRGWRGVAAARKRSHRHPIPAEVAQAGHAASHAAPDARHHGHARHSHSHADDCACGHAHGPSVEDMSRVTGLRDAAALVASIAIRPCTGALFLLILTVQLGIGTVGIMGAYAMGLGTATVTLAVAGLAVWSREGALAALPRAGLARALPIFELGAGLVIAAVAVSLLIGAL